MTKTSLYLLITLCSIVLLTSEVAAHEKVVVVPLSSSTAAKSTQGQGRPGAELMSHSTITGYCTTPSDVKFALSKTLVTWQGAPSACPKNTWVCSNSDIPLSGSCPVLTSLYLTLLECDGTQENKSTNLLLGYTNDIIPSFIGLLRGTTDLGSQYQSEHCKYRRVWCCWK